MAWFAILSAITACSEPVVDEPLTFQYQLGAPVVSLDPAQATDLYSMAIIDRVFDGLLRIEADQQTLVPVLARRYEVSEDGAVYDFYLADSVRFHHGRLVTARDVKASWERLLLQETQPPFARTVSFIAGAEAVIRGETTEISGLEVIGDHHLRIRLTEPRATFLVQIAGPSAAVVPQEEVERLGPRFAREPVGSGPFRFVASVGGSHVELERWEESARPTPTIERLHYRVVADERDALELFLNGELDLVSRLPADLTPGELDALSDRLHVTPGLTWSGFCVRSDRPPFDDRNLRQALSAAIDRDPLVARLGHTSYLAAGSYLPPTVAIHDPKTVDSAFDLDRARELLNTAGFPQGEGLGEIVYATRPNVLDEIITEHVVASLAEVGVRVRPVTLEFSALIDAIHQGRYDMFRWAWVGDYPDPEAFFQASFETDGPSNMMGFSDPEVDALLKEADREVDADQRLQMFRRIDELILEEMPCVNLVYRTERVLLDAKWTGLTVGNPYLVDVERVRLKS